MNGAGPTSVPVLIAERVFQFQADAKGLTYPPVISTTWAGFFLTQRVNACEPKPFDCAASPARSQQAHLV
jgi:hypothetical protein